jgi:putative ABC transport system permease protein
MLGTSAIAFAVVLLFLQLALYDTLEISAVILMNMLDFDAIIIGTQYYNLQQAGSFPRTRMYQAREVPGVRSVSPIYMALMPWRNVDTGSRHSLLILSAALGDPVFRSAEIREQLPLLAETDRVLMDRRTLPYYGPIRKGLVSEAGEKHTLAVAGLFTNGSGFGGGGLLVTSDATFNHLGFSLDTPTLGLIKLQPGQDVVTTVSTLRERLPPDVRVLTRHELAVQETHYWVNVKPIGIMFSSGLYVGMMVGAVILYTVLGTDISRRIREYATMKAMGYSDMQINWTVLQQSFFIMILSFLAGLGVAFGLYDAIARGSGIPVVLGFQRALEVFAMTLVIALTSGILAIRKLRTADPAALF